MPIAWRAREWAGWPPGTLMAAVMPQPRELRVVAVRTDPLRVVVSAQGPLDYGDVRGTRIRLVRAVAATLAELRRSAHLAVGTPLVAVLDACPHPGVVSGRRARPESRIPTISQGARLAYERTAQEAGFTPIGVMAAPDAVARRSATPEVRVPGRCDLPNGQELLVIAAVAALRGELRRNQPELADPVTASRGTVGIVGGAPW